MCKDQKCELRGQNRLRSKMENCRNQRPNTGEIMTPAVVILTARWGFETCCIYCCLLRLQDLRLIVYSSRFDAFGIVYQVVLVMTRRTWKSAKFWTCPALQVLRIEKVKEPRTERHKLSVKSSALKMWHSGGSCALYLARDSDLGDHSDLYDQ